MKKPNILLTIRGILEKALLKIASSYEKEIDRSVKVMTSL